jgi:hypothetical protein
MLGPEAKGADVEMMKGSGYKFVIDRKQTPCEEDEALVGVVVSQRNAK